VWRRGWQRGGGAGDGGEEAVAPEGECGAVVGEQRDGGWRDILQNRIEEAALPGATASISFSCFVGHSNDYGKGSMQRMTMARHSNDNY
jgi:hypothetical protein